jgi:quercetin dioxygenase-like cupin family protein
VKITHYEKIEAVHMDNEMVKGVAGRVAIGKADGADHFCMRVFELGYDGYSPKHSHDWEHEIFVHAGFGEIFLGGKWNTVEAGYTVFIPANEEHQIRNAGDETFVFVCLIPAGIPEM